MAKQGKMQNWADAASAVRTAIDDLATALDELLETQTDIQDSFDNMSDGLQQAETGQRFEAVTQVDVQGARDLVDDIEKTMDEAEKC